MNQPLTINLFGGLAVHLDPAAPPKFASLRAQLLVAWLALHPGPHRRERLADLFWDERDAKRALGNLRTLLARLPKPVKQHLHITTQTLAVDLAQSIRVDLLAFDELLANQRHAEAEALVTGEVLAGVYVEKSEGLEAWMRRLRQSYSQKRIDLLQALAEAASTDRHFGQGVRYAQKLVGVDPLRESSYRLLMRLLARDGRRGEALKVFAQCEEMLAEEFAAEPEPATVALAERLRSGQPVRHNLPMQPTLFIGRREELSTLRTRLDANGARLMTIVGPGGMGKTRLAVQAGELLVDNFLDGVAFVSLANVEQPGLIATSLLGTLAEHGFIQPLHKETLGNRAPVDHLCQQLQHKEMLLILDNFEHVLEARHLLDRLLTCAGHLKILVTSRVRLGLRWEQLIELRGLRAPQDTGASGWQQYDAVRLFVQAAARCAPRIVLGEAERADVARLCRQVGSMPLALELAANWLRLHTVRKITEKIEESARFLFDGGAATPPRQRSLQAVFNYSWSQLTRGEQDALARVAIFRGSFDAEAAAEVVGVADRHLLTLLDHSLLQREVARAGDNAICYTQHPLLREFAWEKLAADAAALAEARTRHAQYYLNRVAAFQPSKRDDNLHLDRFINRNLDNVRAAWRWGVEQSLWSLMRTAMPHIANYWNRSGLNQEGANSLRQAVRAAAANEKQVVVLEFQLELIRFLHNMARYDEALAEIEVATTIFNNTLSDDEKSQTAVAQIYLIWGEMLAFQSKLDTAREKLLASLAISSHIGDALLLGEGLRLLGLVAHYQEGLPEAEENFRKAYRIFQEHSNLCGIARVQNNLGLVYSARGEKLEALAWFQKALATWQEEGDAQSILRTQMNLGNMLILVGRFREGLVQIEKSQRRTEEIENTRGQGYALLYKGRAYAVLGQYGAARQHLERGLRLFQQLGTDREQAAFRNVLALLYLNLEKPREARLQAEEARLIAGDSDHLLSLIAAHSYLGYAFLESGNATKAHGAFENALEIQRRSKKEHGMYESYAGLAAAALLAGQPIQAQAWLLPHAAKLTTTALLATLRPFAVVLTYVQVLRQSAPKLADHILSMGLDMLTAWENEAPDETSRETFRAVPAHRALIELGEQATLQRLESANVLQAVTEIIESA